MLASTMWRCAAITAALCAASAHAAKEYCLPGDACWPAPEEWETLNATVDGRLTPLDDVGYDGCYDLGTNSFLLRMFEGGVCMQAHNCRYEFCADGNRDNTAAYSVEAMTEEDVAAAMVFASTHNIAVTVKTSGHSYAGSSQGYGTLLIWMANFEKFADQGLATHTDTCGTVTEHVVRIGGGQNWGQVYAAVGEERHIIGGGALTVSAAGGWLGGSGLSSTARKYGLGIDQVLDYRLVLVNGTTVTVDACSNPDLFWALRGGGGGTFGVVTSVHYKTHPIENVVIVDFGILPENYLASNVTWIHWIDFWIDTSVDLDRRWGGYWGSTFAQLYFVGSRADAEATYISQLKAMLDAIPAASKGPVYLNIRESPGGYVASRGGATKMDDPNNTDQTGMEDFNISSRLLSKEFIVQNKERLRGILRLAIASGVSFFNYILGGAVMDVPLDATAVQPQMRRAVWQLETFDQETAKGLREFIELNNGRELYAGAAGLNHAAKDEPAWRTSFWGEHYERLEAVKKAVDPENRLNCFHCVGYQGAEGPENGAPVDVDPAWYPETTPAPVGPAPPAPVDNTTSTSTSTRTADNTTTTAATDVPSVPPPDSNSPGNVTAVPGGAGEDDDDDVGAGILVLIVVGSVMLVAAAAVGLMMRSRKTAEFENPELDDELVEGTMQGPEKDAEPGMYLAE